MGSDIKYVYGFDDAEREFVDKLISSDRTIASGEIAGPAKAEVSADLMAILAHTVSPQEQEDV